MKVGDILYFVDVDLGKITKHKVIKKENSNYIHNINFSEFHYPTFENYIHVNPTPKNYFKSISKFYGTNKTYLVFTEVENAHRALIDFVLPKMVEVQQTIAQNLRDKYLKVIEKTERIEKLKKQTIDNFDKKCNALKKKFV